MSLTGAAVVGRLEPENFSMYFSHLDSTGDRQDELIEWSLFEPDDEDVLLVALVEWSLVEPIDKTSIHHSSEDEGGWTTGI